VASLFDALTAPLERARRLDFVIAGAAKAGTSALWAYLRRTPGIYMPPLKELGFFGDDRRYGDGTRFWRLHLWYVFAPRGAIRGEATPSYLYEPQCLPRLAAYNPDIRIVCILRNPVLRAYSGWNFWRWRRRDSVPFLDHIREEMEGLRPGETPQRHPPTAIARSAYAVQIERAQATLPRHNILWLKYEDFVRDQPAAVARTVRFLGAPDGPPIAKIRTINAFPYRRAITEEEYVAALRYLEADIDRVEQLLGWDCSDWRRYPHARS